MRLKFLIIILFLGLSSLLYGGGDSVNAVIGNSSWYCKYQNMEYKQASEVDRIKTHLSYVIDSLSQSLPEGVSKAKRARGIELLREYLAMEQFPTPGRINGPSRVPCFIDDNGNICAVGYLVERTEGRIRAEAINRSFQYHYIKDMDDPWLLDWQARSGFTLEELAMIQPSYEVPALRIVEVQVDAATGKVGLYSTPKNKWITKAKYTSLVPVSENREYFIADVDGIKGVIKQDGKVILDLIYDRISYQASYQVNMFVAHRNDKLSLFDTKGSFIASFEDAQLLSRSYTYMCIGSEGRQGVIDFEGNWILKPSENSISIETVLHFKQLREPSDIFAATQFILTNRLGKIGVWDERGRVVVPQVFDEVKRQQMLWWAKNKEASTIYNIDGDTSGIQKVTAVKNIHHDPGFHQVMVCVDDSCGLMDARLNWTIPPKYEAITESLQYYTCQNRNGYSLYDRYGDVFLPEDLDEVHRYSNVFYFRKNEISGLRLTGGLYLIEPTTDTVRFAGFQEGNTAVFGIKQEGVWRFIGERAIVETELPVQSFKVLDASSSLLQCSIGGKYYLAELKKDRLKIDRSLAFQSLSYLNQGTYRYQQGNKFGLISINHQQEFKLHNLVYPCVLDELYDWPFKYRNIFFARKGEYFGMLGLYGKEALKFEFSDYRKEVQSGPEIMGIYLLRDSEWYYFDVLSRELTSVSQEKLDLLKQSGRNNAIPAANHHLIKER